MTGAELNSSEGVMDMRIQSDPQEHGCIVSVIFDVTAHPLFHTDF